MEIEEILRQSTIFNTLNAEELVHVKNTIREIRFQAGDVIMQEGDEGDTLYMVVQGEVGVSKSLTMKFGDDDFRTTDKVLTRFRSDDHAIFGEMALIARDSRSATIIADTDCLLLEINREDFIRLIEGRPELGVKILLKLSELLINRLKLSSQDIIRLTTALSIALSK
ncbi:MAG: cyclic nucleotide-binding domain-containing protein [Deltaproteobacteria bacterium]|nr:cyclic nucleotide-binding domain-containing protein [Deltaproteobacteria bacterium]